MNEINPKMCPACYNLNNMHALTVFQMNLRQAIYMCSNAEQCLYPQGFGIEIIDRDLYLLSPESDNESDKDDMPLDSITGREFKDEKKPKIETKTEPENIIEVQPECEHDIEQMALDILERLHDTSQIQDLGTDDLNITLFENSKEPQPLIETQSALQRLSPEIYQIDSQEELEREKNITELNSVNSENKTAFNSVINLEDDVQIRDPICDFILPIKKDIVPKNASMDFINNAFLYLNDSGMKSIDEDIKSPDDVKPMDLDITPTESPLKSTIKIFSDVRLNQNIDIKSIPFSQDSTTIDYVSRPDRSSVESDDKKHVLYDLDTETVVVKSDTDECKLESDSFGLSIVKPDAFGIDTVKFDSAKPEEVKVTAMKTRTRKKSAAPNVNTEGVTLQKQVFQNTSGSRRKSASANVNTEKANIPKAVLQSTPGWVNKCAKSRGRPKKTRDPPDSESKPPPKKRTRKLPDKSKEKTATKLKTLKNTTDYFLNLQIVGNKKISIEENEEEKKQPLIASISIPNQSNFTVDLTEKPSISIPNQSSFAVDKLINNIDPERCRFYNRKFIKANEVREKLRKNGGFDKLIIPMIGGKIRET